MTAERHLTCQREHSNTTYNTVTFKLWFTGKQQQLWHHCETLPGARDSCRWAMRWLPVWGNISLTGRPVALEVSRNHTGPACQRCRKCKSGGSMSAGSWRCASNTFQAFLQMYQKTGRPLPWKQTHLADNLVDLAGVLQGQIVLGRQAVEVRAALHLA